MTTIFSSAHWSISRGGTQHPLRDVDVPEAAADVDVLAHRAADQRDLAAVLLGRVHDLLDAVDVRREAGDDDAALAAREHAVQVRADDRLALRDARAVDVRRVAAQQQQALAAELGQPRHVGRRAADRRLVELVVAGEEDGAERRLERDAARVRDRVRQVDALDLERAGVARCRRSAAPRGARRAACARRAWSAPSRSSAGRCRRPGSCPGRGRGSPTAARRGGPRGRA